MKSLQRSFIATSALLALAFVTAAQAELVAPAKAGAQFSAHAGTITHLAGPLLAQNANGRTRVIAQGAAVDVGDTLVTGAATYAEIHFADDSDAILQPDTTLTIDAFAHDASRRDGETARWTLAHGGIQVTSGAIASSGPGHHTIATPVGTIAVTPSKFVVKVSAPAPVALAKRVYLAENTTGTMSDVQAPIIVAQSLGPAAGGSAGPPVLAPGLHLQVTDGAIVVTNNGGSLGFQAGQFGFVPSVNQPPIIVPLNPGIQFTPPPSFNSGSGGPTASTGSGQGKGTDCVVR